MNFVMWVGSLGIGGRVFGSRFIVRKFRVGVIFRFVFGLVWGRVYRVGVGRGGECGWSFRVISVGCCFRACVERIRFSLRLESWFGVF